LILNEFLKRKYLLVVNTDTWVLRWPVYLY